MWIYHRVMSPNDADGAGSALFDQTYLSENLGSLRELIALRREGLLQFPHPFIVNFPLLSSNIPSALAYGVYVWQLIRFTRLKEEDCWSKAYNKPAKLGSTLRKFHALYDRFRTYFWRVCPIESWIGMTTLWTNIINTAGVSERPISPPKMRSELVDWKRWLKIISFAIRHSTNEVWFTTSAYLKPQARFCF